MINQSTAIVLTALRVEYEAVRRHLSNLSEIVHPSGTVYERGVFHSASGDWNIIICETGAGNAGAGIAAERAIAYFLPKYAFFVGVAGGIKDVSLGDVVASTKIYGYEAGAARKTFEPRPDVGQSGYALIQRAVVEARSQDWVDRGGTETVLASPNALVGPIAAGEKVVKSVRSEVFRFLRTQYGDALAVEMEGRGFLQAVHANSNVQGIVIRGISDLIQNKAEADLAGSQPIASRHAAAFAFQMLAKLGAGIEEVGTTSASKLQSVAFEDAVSGSFWDILRNTVIVLYPHGPEEKHLWDRAGGNISTLNLGGDGNSQWYSALRMLQNGGGGVTISAQSLIGIMLQDFPRNSDIQQLMQSR